jgi:hypothetical protein
MASRGLGKQQPPLWSLPVSQRPPLSLASLLTVTLPLTVGFIVVFDVGILATVLLLVLLYPLYYGSIRTRRTYRQLGKRAFGRLLVLIVRWFSPTELVLSAGRGHDQGEDWIERDTDGKLVSLKLPEKALWVRCRPRWLFRPEDHLLKKSCPASPSPDLEPHDPDRLDLPLDPGLPLARRGSLGLALHQPQKLAPADPHRRLGMSTLWLHFYGAQVGDRQRTVGEAARRDCARECPDWGTDGAAAVPRRDHRHGQHARHLEKVRGQDPE